MNSSCSLSSQLPATFEYSLPNILLLNINVTINSSRSLSLQLPITHDWTFTINNCYLLLLLLLTVASIQEAGTKRGKGATAYPSSSIKNSIAKCKFMSICLICPPPKKKNLNWRGSLLLISAEACLHSGLYSTIEYSYVTGKYAWRDWIS